MATTRGPFNIKYCSCSDGDGYGGSVKDDDAAGRVGGRGVGTPSVHWGTL